MSPISAPCVGRQSLRFRLADSDPQNLLGSRYQSVTHSVYIYGDSEPAVLKPRQNLRTLNVRNRGDLKIDVEPELQSSKSGGPYGPYSIFSPRYGPYSKVGTYSIEDNIDLILAWVHTNRPPIRKPFENRTVDSRCLCLRLFLAAFL